MPDEQSQHLELNIDFTIEEGTRQLKFFEWGPGISAGYEPYRLVSDITMHEKIFLKLLEKVDHIYIVNEEDGRICRQYLPHDYIKKCPKQIKFFKNFLDFISKVKASPDEYLSGENVILLDDIEGKLNPSSSYTEYKDVLALEGINIPILSSQCLFYLTRDKAGFADFWKDAPAFIPKTKVIDVTNVDNFQKSLSNVMAWSCEQYILKPDSKAEAEGIVVLNKEELPIVMQMLACEEGVGSFDELALGKEEKKKLKELQESIYEEREHGIDAHPFIIQELINLKRLEGYAVTGRMVLVLTYNSKMKELEIELVDAFWKSPVEQKKPGEKFNNANTIASFKAEQLPPEHERLSFPTDDKGLVDVIPADEVKFFVKLFNKEEKTFLLGRLNELSPFFKKLFERKAQQYLMEADQFSEWTNRDFKMSTMNFFNMTFDDTFIQHLKHIKYANFLLVLLCKFFGRMSVYIETKCLDIVDVKLLDEIKEASNCYQKEPHILKNVTDCCEGIYKYVDVDNILKKKLQSHFPQVLDMFSAIYNQALGVSKNISSTEPSKSSLQKKALQIANKYYSDGLTAFNANNAKKYQVAESYWLAANRVYIKQKNKVKEGSCYSNLASCYRDTGQYGKAVEYAKRALEIKKASSKTTADELQKIEKKYVQCVKLFEEHENKNDEQKNAAEEEISSVSFSF